MLAGGRYLRLFVAYLRPTVAYLRPSVAYLRPTVAPGAKGVMRAKSRESFLRMSMWLSIILGHPRLICIKGIWFVFGI